MKKFLLSIVVLSISGVLYSQTTSTPAKPKAATPTTSTAPAASAVPASSKAIENGFGALSWGSNFETVKAGIKGMISYSEENKMIISKDGEISYKYGFFYVDPQKIGVLAKTAAASTPTTGPTPAVPATTAPSTTAPAATPATDPSAAKFSYMVIEFPYLNIDDVKAKYNAKYGNPTAENVKKNTGAIIYDSEKTTIILWVDEYEKKPFCRKINYVSKDVAKEIADYYVKIFNQVEIDTLNKMNP